MLALHKKKCAASDALQLAALLPHNFLICPKEIPATILSIMYLLSIVLFYCVAHQV